MTTPGEERKVALLLAKPYFLRAKQHIVARARELNWRIHDLAHYHNKIPDDLTPDALLTDELWDTPFYQRIRSRSFPKVRLGRFEHPKDSLYPAVVADLASTARMIADHLAERNFRHIAFIAYNLEGFHYKHLYDPLTEYAAELGIECHLLDFKPLPSLEHTERERLRERQLMEWIHDLPKPVAFVGFSEDLSALICTRCLDAGISVPNQVAILSCGDDPLVCNCTPVQLSSVPTTGLAIANTAIDLLQNLMNGEPPPQSTVFVTPLRVNIAESTDVLATDSPDVAHAVRFMRDSLDKSISVDDVAAATGISRRKLERIFRQQTSRAINAELLRLRLESCCQLLLATDLPVVDIVPRIGFSSTAYLHKTFRRKYGLTPQAFRKLHKRPEASA
jgi:LacI family transcriptional regulator